MNPGTHTRSSARVALLRLAAARNPRRLECRPARCPMRFNPIDRLAGAA
ncbi:MAG: hypothetical protein ING77_09295 [Rhodocyclaceae bacterium]|nr:hypothetical protein [Rhodocyclaceae bacterium]MCA3075596.1 hypothetical protein [Rhodocyclaceae bacterium]MCA3092050.1 hypothetical protein [Rhodocyclaceae bacterium]MCA3095993.1 hypothetical protein [Rhodocyclaceae bacterium]MCA3099596.1 hypothetical protein [Rhodocyclaceae bacterium]